MSLAAVTVQTRRRAQPCALREGVDGPASHGLHGRRAGSREERLGQGLGTVGLLGALPYFTALV